MEPVIQFNDYGFQYLAQAEPTLKNINLSIYQGERVLIAGASGSGKSTLGNCLNGLIPYTYKGETSGRLIVDGKETQNSGIFELSQSVGTVLQDTDGQFIGLTVAEDIAFALENDCVEQEEMIQIVKDTASMVDIGEELLAAPYALSGGQKQRVSLAGVMVDNVKILLFDEPLANLDPYTGKATMELIDRIHKETHKTIIVIEHRIEDVLWTHMDRIILMNEGEIVADLSTSKMLQSRYLSEYGLREPLYITALKYAKTEITDEIKAEHIQTLNLSQNNIRCISDFYGQYTSTKEVNSKTSSILSLKNITFGYTKDKLNLKNVSLELSEGEMVSIIGKNGAGKSTLSKIICGFEIQNNGKIYFQDNCIDQNTIKERAQKIGYVMQNPNQMISKPMIWDEVELALLSTDMSISERKERVEEALRICGLYQFRKWPISALSYGQKKRVTIASVLVQRPKLILLDEPTAGQDYQHYTEIMEFLKTLNEKGYTIVMITHDMHLMLEYSERAIVLCDGEIIADDSPARILSNTDIIQKANLKETSLYKLSLLCDSKPEEFIQNFINYEREVARWQKLQS